MKVPLSVVVPAFNCQDTIEDCLVSIRRSACQAFELIVADDGSSDQTAAIARKYADKLVMLPHAGRSAARKSGQKVAEGSILVNIDSDVLIKADTLSRISDFFNAHPRADALTGCLSKNSLAPGYFSQYKHLYMHYIFSKLPERVTFLYGSVYAVRADPDNFHPAELIAETADDTALGQSYTAAGKTIFFLKDLQVAHLKEFTLASFFKNDFEIPFDWAKIFLRYQGWKQIGKGGTGYCHAPREQLLSVIMAPLLFVLTLITVFGQASVYAPLGAAFFWSLLNMRFLAFLTREKGLVLGVQAIPVTFFDHITMALGIVCGGIAFMVDKRTMGNMPS